MAKKNYVKVTQENYGEWLKRRKKKDSFEEFERWFFAVNNEETFQNVVVKQVYYIKSRFEKNESNYKELIKNLIHDFECLKKRIDEQESEINYLNCDIDELYIRQDELSEVRCC